MPISELVVLAGGLNQTPTISLDTADSHSFGSDSTPTLLFTGTDADGDDLTYRIQIDTVNTFDSQGGGVDNALSLSDNGALYKTTDQKDNNIAFFCWIKRSADGSKDIFFNGNNGSYGEGYSFRLNSSDVLAIDLSYLAELASSFDLTGDTDWHFVGFQRRGTQWVIYFDDQEEVVGTTDPYSISASQKIIVGGKNSDGTVTYNFDGLIAKVGYWTRTLTDDEILAFKRSGDPADVGDAVIDLPLNNSGAWGTNEGSGGNLSTDGTLTLSSSTFDAIEGVPLIDKKAAEVTKREYLTPNSNVVTTGWGAEGGPDYTSVDDPVGSPDEATTKVYTPSAGDLFSVGLTNSALSSEKIAKVIAVLRVKAADPVANRVQAYLTISSTNYFSSDLYFSAQGIFHNLTAEWDLNPATGLAWTVSDLDALILGIKKIDSNGCYLTQMYIVVEYESSDAGFANEDTPADTALFNSGDQISFTVQAGDALSDGTYYWRAIDKDTNGTDQWSAWPTTRSFTISSGGTEYTLTCTDSATMVDTINKATSRTFAEAGIMVDSILKQIARGIVEVATMVDNVKKDQARTISAAPVLVDSINKSTARSISDATATSDSINKTSSRGISEAVPLVDSVIRAISRAISETATMVDTISHVVSVFIAQTISEATTLVDAIQKSTSRAIGETATMVDTVNRGASRGIIEATTMVDTVKRTTARGIVAAVTMVDSIQKNIARIVQEVSVVGDFLGRMFRQEATEAITATDSLLREVAKTIAEEISVVDEIATKIIGKMRKAITILFSKTKKTVMVPKGRKKAILKNKEDKTVVQ